MTHAVMRPQQPTNFAPRCAECMTARTLQVAPHVHAFVTFCVFCLLS